MGKLSNDIFDSGETYPCPYCKAKAVRTSPFFPFCSERCKVNDLGAWASEKYKIAGSPVTEDDSISSDSSDPYSDEFSTDETSREKFH